MFLISDGPYCYFVSPNCIFTCGVVKRHVMEGGGFCYEGVAGCGGGSGERAFVRGGDRESGTQTRRRPSFRESLRGRG